MKIPTLLGLSLLSIAVILGISIYYLKEASVKQTKAVYEPRNVTVVNITSSSASITWQTKNPISSQLVLSQNPTTQELKLDDDRGNQVRLTHFVTVKNLETTKKYYFWIKNGGLTYREPSYEFKTSDKKSGEFFSTPVRGTILNQSLNPVDEALVFLNISEKNILGSFSTNFGNFIIPVNFLSKEQQQTKLNATLIATRGDQQTVAKIVLPLKEDILLPSIILGEKIDLTEKVSTQSGFPKTKEVPKHNKFDLNSDGVLNTLDVSIVLDNFGKKPKNKQSLTVFKQADLNSDGKVDTRDFELIKKELE